ncbi:hypothetical protein, partial [Enterobacter hormaechei]
RCTIEINDAFVLGRSRFFSFVIVVPLVLNLPARPSPRPGRQTAQGVSLASARWGEGMGVGAGFIFNN